MVALLGLYYLVPFDDSLGVPLLVWLAVALALIAVLAYVEIRAILHSALPRMRAIEALMTVIPLLLVVFAATYYLMADADSANFSEPLTRTDSLYFVITVLSTVGLGDVTADSQAARAVVSAQILLNLVVVGLGVRVVVGAADERRRFSRGG